MATDNRYRGILRTDYEAAQARLKGFVPMTTDEAQLLHRLGQRRSDCSPFGRITC